MSKEPTSFMQELKWVWATLGVLATAASIINLIQRVFGVGLNGSLDELVRYYRELLAPITQMLSSAIQSLLFQLNIQWHVPHWYSDAAILSAVGSAIAARGQSKFISDLFRNRWIAWAVLLLTMAISTISLYGLVSLAIVAMMMVVFTFGRNHFGLFSHEAVAFGLGGHQLPDARDKVIATFRRIARLGWVTLAAVVGFYVLNQVLQVSL